LNFVVFIYHLMTTSKSSTVNKAYNIFEFKKSSPIYLVELLIWWCWCLSLSTKVA